MTERIHYVTESRLELKVGISEELQTQLKRVQDLESQRTGMSATLEETLQALADLYLEKRDPVRRAERAKTLVPGQNQETPKAASETGSKTEKARKPLPMALKHAIMKRDQGQCTHREGDGIRCSERRWIDIHHIRQKSHGGSDTLSNLTTLCRGHHQVIHDNTGTQAWHAGVSLGVQEMRCARNSNAPA